MFSFRRVNKKWFDFLRNLPVVGAFLPYQPARFSSSPHHRADNGRRNYHPSGDHVVTAGPTDANNRNHSSASAYPARLPSPVASTENFPSRRRVTRQGQSPKLAPTFLAHSTNCEI